MQSNQLFKRHKISIPIDLIRTELEKPIDKNSLTQSEGQRKKRKLAEGTSEASTVGITELQDTITNLRIEFDTRMIRLEEQSGHHTTMLQEIKGILIQMQSKDEEEEED